MHLAALHSSFRDYPCWQPVNVGNLGPCRGELLPLAALLGADKLIGPRDGQDREAECPRVVAIEGGNPFVERRHVAVRHGFVVLDLIVARAALDDDAGLCVPDDSFNPTLGLPSRRLPKLFESVILALLIHTRHRQPPELRNLPEGPSLVPPLPLP